MIRGFTISSVVPGGMPSLFFSKKSAISWSAGGFTYGGQRFEVPLIGRHNLENALTAVRLCEALGCDRAELARALPRFRGVGRRLERVALTLDQARSGVLPSLPPAEGDGYLIVSLAGECLPLLLAARSELKPFVRQAYPRFFAALDTGFDAYLAGFSAKSRSTLKRKRRKLEEAAGGHARLARRDTVVDGVRDYIFERLRAWYGDAGIAVECFLAVQARGVWP